jgi:RNA polymerase sigma-B factor
VTTPVPPDVEAVEPSDAEVEADLAADPDVVAATQELATNRSERIAADRARARALFVELNNLPEGDPARAKLRDELVEIHLPLVEYLARRFRNRGEPLDDLVQVATIGLIKSVDRFDLSREVEFSTYATPTIVGEIKRHFRDKGWAIRVPRRLQELKLALTKATSCRRRTVGRPPWASSPLTSG